ncbi:MAG TPA: hypothetical protein PKD24_15575 [Pyrinomonadaceae bacterium]|nr:hypothetical protein [Pyrinomonadaceae bacterium]HMP66280.1 hypothetical protein [Pyrinomonadaceae bacterium]
MERRVETSSERSSILYGVSANADIWVLIPRLVVGIFVSTGLLLLLFWFQFGAVTSYIFLIALLFALFQVLLVIGLRHRKTFDPTVPKMTGALDRIGAFWLIAVFFGAIVAWFTGDWAANYPDHAVSLHSLTVFFAVALPVATSIPNYRYVTAQNAYISVPLLAVVSLMPSIVAWRSAAFLLNSLF